MFKMDHQKIVNLGVLLGYFPDAKGCCTAFTLKWLEACMLNEEHLFNQRVKTITNSFNIVSSIKSLFSKNPVNTLLQQINDTKEKVKQHQQLDDNEVNLLEILAFYENMALIQFPEKALEIYSDKQLIENLPIITASDKMTTLGVLTTVYSTLGDYSIPKNTDKFLDHLSQAIETTNYSEQTTIGFTLTASNHAIGLTYQTHSKCWTFMDINQWPSIKITTQEIAQRLPRSFNTNAQHPHTFFNIKISTPLHQKQRQQLVDQLNQHNFITKDIAKHAEITNIMIRAVQTGHVDLITQLAQYDVSVNATNAEGLTLVHIAIRNGRMDVLIKLKELGANLNTPDAEGSTPLMYAATLGFLNAIGILEPSVTTINEADKQGYTSIHYAILSNNVDVITKFQELGAAIDTSWSENSPAYIAVKSGSVNMIEKLYDLGTDYNAYGSLLITAANLAYANQHHNVLDKFHELGIDFFTPPKDEIISPELYDLIPDTELY